MIGYWCERAVGHSDGRKYRVEAMCINHQVALSAASYPVMLVSGTWFTQEHRGVALAGSCRLKSIDHLCFATCRTRSLPTMAALTKYHLTRSSPSSRTPAPI